MAFLTTIRAAPGSRRIDVVPNTRRIAFLAVLVIVMLAVAAVLHATDRETAAAWFTGMGEALLFGALGVLVGETTGARETESRLFT